MDHLKISATLLALAAGSTMSANTKPNIVVMIADDCTYRDLGCYGSVNSITPNIDGLAKESMKFTNCFQAAPMSSPTRHCLMTGLYPVRSGAYPNHTFVQDGTKSVVQYMSEEGYRVALQGKRHISPESIFSFEYLGKENIDVDTSRIRPFILDTQEKGEPFCLFVCSHQPHTPWNKGDVSLFDPDKLVLPSYYADTPETRQGYAKYLAEVNYLDSQVGAVLSLLEKTGVEYNTVFIFTSEQGNSLPFAKWTCYDMGLQSGLLVRWPGIIPGKQTSDAMVEYVDFVPTLVDIAGGTPPAGLDGKSFKAVLEGKVTEHKSEVYGLQTSNGIHNGPDEFGIRSVRNKRYIYIRNLNPDRKFSCASTNPKDKVWKSWMRKASGDKTTAELVRKYTHRPAEELYDRIKDPDQKRNLADKKRFADIKAELSAKLDNWMKQQGDEGVLTEREARKHQIKEVH